MAQPKLKANEWHSELTPPNVVHELRVHTIIRECRALLKTITDTEHAALLHSTIGVGYCRLKNANQAIEALRRARLLQPWNGETAANLGCAYLLAHDYDRALTEFEFAVENTPRPATAWANIAETKSLLGDYDGCVAAFNMATAAASPSSLFDLFALASQAAEIGLEREASDLWSTWIERRGGGLMSEQDMAVLDDHPALKRAVLARPRADAVASLAALPEDPDARDEERARAFEDFSDMRKHANAVVLNSPDA